MGSCESQGGQKGQNIVIVMGRNWSKCLGIGEKIYNIFNIMKEEVAVARLEGWMCEKVKEEPAMTPKSNTCVKKKAEFAAVKISGSGNELGGKLRHSLVAADSNLC